MSPQLLWVVAGKVSSKNLHESKIEAVVCMSVRGKECVSVGEQALSQCTCSCRVAMQKPLVGYEL